MTDETRAELRLDLTTVVACAGLPGAFLARAEVVHDQVLSTSYRSWATGVCVPFDPQDDELPNPPPLTPFQRMCLAGLLGDPGQLEAAVVDYLLDSGHEYATAAYERGKRDGVEHCRSRVLLYREEAADGRRVVAVDTLDTVLSDYLPPT